MKKTTLSKLSLVTVASFALAFFSASAVQAGSSYSSNVDGDADYNAHASGPGDTWADGSSSVPDNYAGGWAIDNPQSQYSNAYMNQPTLSSEASAGIDPPDGYVETYAGGDVDGNTQSETNLTVGYGGGFTYSGGNAEQSTNSWYSADSESSEDGYSQGSADGSGYSFADTTSEENPDGYSSYSWADTGGDGEANSLADTSNGDVDADAGVWTDGNVETFTHTNGAWDNGSSQSHGYAGSDGSARYESSEYDYDSASGSDATASASAADGGWADTNGYSEVYRKGGTTHAVSYQSSTAVGDETGTSANVYGGSGSSSSSGE